MKWQQQADSARVEISAALDGAGEWVLEHLMAAREHLLNAVEQYEEELEGDQTDD